MTEKFGLIIIESLPDKEKTGQLLHESIIKYKKFQESNLTSTICVLETKEELLNTLSEIITLAEAGNYTPFLHFEIHGFNGGLQMASGELVYWQELVPYFRKLNIILQNYLIIMLGVCEGNNLNLHIDPTDRAPFRAVIGTFKKPTWNDILKGFETFYDSYFFELDPFESVRLMNLAISPNEETFSIMPSEIFFEKMLDPDREPEFFKKMVLDLAIYKKLFDPLYQNLPLAEVRLHFDKRIRDDFEETKKNIDYFTMKDLKNNLGAAG